MAVVSREQVYKYLLRVLTPFSFAILLGCGSSSGTSALMTHFEPLPHTVTANHVDIVPNIDQSIGNRVAVDIRVNQISEPVFNAALDLAYDPNIIRFVYHIPGNFLEFDSNGPQNVSYEINPQDTATNDLVVGVSQTGSNAGNPGSTGSGTLVTLVFEPVNNGCSVLNFAKLKDQNGNVTTTEKSALVRPDGSVINGILFSQGGHIRVRQEGETEACIPKPQTP